MRQKTENKFARNLFLVILSLAVFGVLVSALTLTSSPTTLNDFFKIGDNVNVTITASNFVAEGNNVTFSALDQLTISSAGSQAVFNIQSLPSGENTTKYNVNLNSIIGNFPIGVYSSNLNIVGQEVDADENLVGDPVQKQVPLNYVSSFCKNGPMNATELELEVNVKNTGNGDENEWQPLDKVEVEVRLHNNDDVDLRDVIFKVGLFEQGTTKNVIEDMTWVSTDEDEYDLGDVDSGESSSRYTFEFRVNPSEIKLDKNYLLVVKAYPDSKESTTCIDYSSGLTESGLGSSKYFGEVSVKGESSRDKMVIVDDYKASENPVQAQCGEEVNLLADIYNIGTKDFEDRIKVNLYNQELGLNVNEVVLGDLGSGETTKVNFHFTTPKNIKEKVYPLSLATYYDYKESGDIYRETSSDTFTFYLDVKNCVVVVTSDVLVSATLESEAKAGQEVSVKISLTNTGETGKIFVVEASDYDSWGEASVGSATIFIPAGGSADSVLKFNAKEDAVGEKTFNVKVSSEGRLLQTQPVALTIEESEEESKGFFGTLFNSLTKNKSLLALAILNIIVIILIIIVVLRISRR